MAEQERDTAMTTATGPDMGTERMAAFTDGVVAIIITIMVLELKVPQGHDLAALRGAAPVFVAYLLSYINVGIYWNNHHHMLQSVRRVSGRALWANLGLLFWLSLLPFVIRWMDEAGLAALPTASYGFVLACAAISYFTLQWELVRLNGGSDSALGRALGSDRKGKLSLTLYIAAIPLAYVAPWISVLLYVAVALLWFVPDRRIEQGAG